MVTILALFKVFFSKKSFKTIARNQEPDVRRKIPWPNVLGEQLGLAETPTGQELLRISAVPNVSTEPGPILEAGLL